MELTANNSIVKVTTIALQFDQSPEREMLGTEYNRTKKPYKIGKCLNVKIPERERYRVL